MSTLENLEILQPLLNSTDRKVVASEAMSLAQLNDPEINALLLEIAKDWDRFMHMYEAARALALCASHDFLTLPVIEMLSQMVVDAESLSRLQSLAARF